LFQNRIHTRLGQIHPTAIIGQRVTIGEGSIIGPFVVIEDDCVIGQRCEIRSHALIRAQTFIGNDCVIGHGAELKHAYVCDRAKIQGHTFVGDSIIGRGARIGTGVVIANRRFDQQPIAWRGPDGQISNTQEKVGALIGDYARLGANVSTNPGIIIGAYTWISSGNIVTGFIADEKFVTVDGRVLKNEQAIELVDVDEQDNR
jgi:bifunctional UDP-N-acetylglucosamine pyrophosphorylase/glucosamine-1-phosphate N-acetyltransferase